MNPREELERALLSLEGEDWSRPEPGHEAWAWAELLFLGGVLIVLPVARRSLADVAQGWIVVGLALALLVGWLSARRGALRRLPPFERAAARYEARIRRPLLSLAAVLTLLATTAVAAGWDLVLWLEGPATLGPASPVGWAGWVLLHLAVLAGGWAVARHVRRARAAPSAQEVAEELFPQLRMDPDELEGFGISTLRPGGPERS